MTNVIISKIGAFLLPLAFLTSNSIDNQKATPSIPPFEELSSVKSIEIQAYQDTYTFSAEADFVNTRIEGCDSIQIRVYSTNNTTGQKRLIHSALVLSGHGCGDMDGMVLLSTTFYGAKSLPDYLLEDQKPDGEPIIPFLNEHPDVYKEYVLKREKIQH